MNWNHLCTCQLLVNPFLKKIIDNDASHMYIIYKRERSKVEIIAWYTSGGCGLGMSLQR